MPRKATESTAYSAVGPAQHSWEPKLSRLPWKGLCALILSIAGVIVAVAILAVSNGDEVKHWRFQPTVYLAIASTVTNITLTYALFEGVSVSWWCKALKDGTTAADLHRIWDFGTSFISALLCGRHVNLIAVASLLVALSPINGPLLQRATTLGPASVDTTQNLQVNVAKLVPQYFTGIATGRGTHVNMLTTNFSVITKDFYSRAPVPFKSGCIDTCRASIPGAGFHVNCSSYQAPYNASQSEPPIPVANIFGTYFTYDTHEAATTASLDIQYKPEIGCTGELIVRNCSLAAGTVAYDVVIDGPSSTISLAPGTTVWNDTIIGPPDLLLRESGSGLLSTYGGMFLALSNRLTTTLQLRSAGAIGWEYLGSQGESAMGYARNIGSGRATCNITFADPTADYLQDIRSLMFRTAVLSANETDRQMVTAIATGSHTIYKTNYTFTALATFVSLLPIVVVLLTFHGSQHLGREVSLSPLEIARAFDAPILRNSNSNSPARALLKQVGYRPVKYGVVSDNAIRRKPVSTQFIRTPYSDLAVNGDATPDFTYSNTIPGEAHQRHGSYHDSPNHVSWQSGFESDLELMDSHQRAASNRAHLEIADPKRVMPIEKGRSFSNW